MVYITNGAKLMIRNIDQENQGVIRGRFFDQQISSKNEEIQSLEDLVFSVYELILIDPDSVPKVPKAKDCTEALKTNQNFVLQNTLTKKYLSVIEEGLVDALIH